MMSVRRWAFWHPASEIDTCGWHGWWHKRQLNSEIANVIAAEIVTWARRLTSYELHGARVPAPTVSLNRSGGHSGKRSGY